MQVLVLGMDYRPLGVVNERRAANLLLAGKAQTVEDARPLATLRSPNRSLTIGSIVRLSYYVHVPVRDPKRRVWSRRGVMERDGYHCGYCGRSLTHAEATIDHIEPQWKCRAIGIEPNRWVNTVTSCRACQARKGGRSLNESGLKLKVAATYPRTNYLVVRGEGGIPTEWAQYLEVRRK